jgi:hypothetical protein
VVPGGAEGQAGKVVPKLQALGEVVVHCVHRFYRNRGHFPNHVIIYRYGTDEGQFQAVIKSLYE